MVGGGRRPDRAFLSKAKKSDGPSEQRAPAQPDPAKGRGSPKKSIHYSKSSPFG
ncbi:hypothetical protein SGRA_3621 [Saprospira grandis str. Lewin]|uniref:Uncharacterized protein n=1 Tax=Saprospira grandis (strain Lewin) TaxID=984262 RepID=H6L5U5_SAPGL|nr:hypothetical protein SGRA_3621 [Saprospira grandis str. Lewin]